MDIRIDVAGSRKTSWRTSKIRLSNKEEAQALIEVLEGGDLDEAKHQRVAELIENLKTMANAYIEAEEARGA